VVHWSTAPARRARGDGAGPEASGAAARLRGGTMLAMRRHTMEGAPEQTSLVHRCVSGDRDAWRALHGRYHGVASAYLRKLGVPGGELDDACQEVFLRVFRYLPRFRGQAQLKTWLYRLCLTEARIARRRGEAARRVVALAHQDVLSRPVAAGSPMTDGMTRRHVDAALAALTTEEREVLVLSDVRGLRGGEIADITGSPLPTVWRRLHCARRTFKSAILGQDSGEDGGKETGTDSCKDN
jgi:RNA polymerase sigma-70 factor (ECF subfamily)